MQRIQLAAITIVCLLALTPTATGQPLTPFGPDFQLNTYTTSCQQLPATASTTDGVFLAVWDSCGSAGTDDTVSIQLQLFDATGALLGTDFQVNTYTSGYQDAPDVAGSPDGSFLVAWASVSVPRSAVSSRSTPTPRTSSATPASPAWPTAVSW